ncbi:MAG: DMT family transporter [Anaeroplasma sp.]
MNKNNIIGIISLLICTIVWGSAFVAQSMAGEYIEPFYVNAIRFFIGGIVLIPLCFVFKDKNKIVNKKKTITGGILVGLMLCIASNLQQIGIVKTTPGKAGFLTAMNIVFVPIISFVIYKKKINYKQIIGIILAVIGMGLLTLDNNFSINIGDLLCLGCAFFFAIHIIFVDYFSKDINSILLSMISFFVASIFSLFIALPFEKFDLHSFYLSLPYILYLGIASCGIGYTLQIVGQKRITEVKATLLLSLEAVFSVIFSFLILKQMLEVQEIIGCFIMLIGVIIVQIADIKIQKAKNNE